MRLSYKVCSHGCLDASIMRHLQIPALPMPLGSQCVLWVIVHRAGGLEAPHRDLEGLLRWSHRLNVRHIGCDLPFSSPCACPDPRYSSRQVRSTGTLDQCSAGNIVRWKASGHGSWSNRFPFSSFGRMRTTFQ